jgi:hypothetical protein
MRFFWIGAGHVEVIDLTSKELVARQSGFSLLADTDKGVSKYGWWGPAKVCPTGEGENIGTFLRSVFKPNKK